MRKQIIKLLVILCLHLPIMSMAQVQVALHVEPTPSSKLSEWVDRSEIATLMINNVPQTLIGTQYKIEASLSIDGGLVVETISELMPARTFNDATEVLTVENIIPYEALRFYGNVKDVMISSGYLPPGNYQFCVRLVGLNGTVLSVPEQACAPMFLTDYQMPELIYPKDITLSKEMLLGGMFTWSQVTPQPDPSMGLKYIFALTEVQPGQTPAQAFSVNRPIVEEEVGSMTSYNLPWDTDIDPTKKYVWSVKPVRDDDTAYKTTNYGYVAFAQFSLDGVVETNNNLEDIIFHSKDSKGNLFEFKAQAKTDDEGRYSGKGTVHVDWMNADVAVVFNEISLDENNLLIDGNVLSQISKGAPRFPTTGQKTAWTTNTADNIITWVNRGNKLKYGSSQSAEGSLLEMPIGIDFGRTTPLTVAVTELVFAPQQAHLRGVNVQKLPLEWNTPVENMGFIMENIEFSKEEILAFNDATVMENLKFQNINGKIDFAFLKPQQRNTKGCYLKWNEGGIARIGLALQAVFTKEWFKSKEDGGKVMSVFTGESKNWEDLILSGKLSNAEIVGTNGMVLNSADLKYDMSDTENPKGMNFPKIYKDAGLDDTFSFRGFYAEKSNISLPKLFKNKNGGAVAAKADNIIITDLGLIADVATTNQSNKESLDYRLTGEGFRLSIDTVNLKVFNSSVTESEIKGDIILKILNPFDRFRYQAMFQHAETNSMNMEIISQRPFLLGLLGARLRLDKNSKFIIKSDEEKTDLNMELNGRLDLSHTFVKQYEDLINYSPTGFGFEKFNFNFTDIKLEKTKIGLTILKTGEKKFTFDEGSWNFNAKIKKFEGYSFKFDGIRFLHLNPEKGELFRGALQVGGRLLLADAVAGSTTLKFQGAIDKELMPYYKGIHIDKVGVMVDVPYVYFRGDLTLRKNHPVYGTGFQGNLNAEITPIGIGMDADVFFGRVDSYTYWKAEVGAKIPAPGIPFMAGLSFRKFGGGAYWNMAYDRDLNSVKEYKFRPRKGYKGLIAKTTIATMAVPNTFNADAKLSIQLNRRNGLDRVFFDGRLWALSKSFTERGRQSSLIKGRVSVEYNPTGQIFDLKADATARLDSDFGGIEADAPLHLYADGRGYWFFHFGTPMDVVSMKLNLGSWKFLNLSAETYGYFMFGNKNVDFPEEGFTKRFLDRYEAAFYEKPRVGLNGGPATTGAGFAFGAGVYFGASTGEIPIVPWVCGAKGYGEFSGEFNGALLKYKPNSDCGGFYGWRATGSVGAYLTAGIKVCGKTLASAGAAALFRAELPNPSYVEGQVTLGYSFLWGLIKGTVHPTFSSGRRCRFHTTAQEGLMQSGKNFSDAVKKAHDKIETNIIDYIIPDNLEESGNINKSVSPVKAMFNFDPVKPMSFKYKYVDDKGMSRGGNIKIRMKYKVEVSQKRYSYDDGSFYRAILNLPKGKKSDGSLNLHESSTRMEYIEKSPIYHYVDNYGVHQFYNDYKGRRWESNSEYTFTITAYLERELLYPSPEDYEIKSTWIPYKKNGVQVKETRVVKFTTFKPGFMDHYKKIRQTEKEAKRYDKNNDNKLSEEELGSFMEALKKYPNLLNKINIRL